MLFLSFVLPAVTVSQPLFQRQLREHGSYVGATGLIHGQHDMPPTNLSANIACTSDVLVDVSPEIVARSWDIVRISWDAVTMAGDWVGVYSPPSSPNSKWLDYYHIGNKSEVYSGMHTRLLNMREAYELRYFRGGLCIGNSSPVRFAYGEFEPVGGHLQLAHRREEDTAVRIIWQSGLNYPKPIVEWGYSSGQLAYHAFGTSATYTAGDMCGAPANITDPQRYRDVGFFHSALIDDLPPDAEVFYRFGQGNAWSLERSFRAPVKMNARDKKWSFVMYADQGTAGHAYKEGFNQMGTESPGPGYLNKALQAHIDTTRGTHLEPRMVLHVGDISYGWSCGFTWELWQAEVEPVATRVPYMVSVGNHEYDYVNGQDKDHSTSGKGPFLPEWGNYGVGGGDGAPDSFGECGVPFVHRFPMPPPTGHGIWWYSFTYANVYIAMLSSEHDFTVGSNQYAWLARELDQIDRHKHPWVIVTSHRPAYESENYEGDWQVGQRMAHELDSLLLKYQVNLFLAGHYHYYQRTCPVSAGTCKEGQNGEPSAPVHLTVGSAGYPSDDPPGFKAVSWVESSIRAYGYVEIAVKGADSLHLIFRGSRNSSDFKILDETTLLPYEAR